MPETQSDQEIATIARQIANYLKTRPRAADTLEGITKWWLTRQRYEEQKDRVAKALEHLVSKGVVSKTQAADGKIVYAGVTGRT